MWERSRWGIAARPTAFAPFFAFLGASAGRVAAFAGALSPSVDQTSGTASPRSARSRSSVSERPTAAASQGRSVGALAISLMIRSSRARGISATRRWPSGPAR